MALASGQTFVDAGGTYRQCIIARLSPRYRAVQLLLVRALQGQLGCTSSTESMLFTKQHCSQRIWHLTTRMIVCFRFGWLARYPRPSTPGRARVDGIVTRVITNMALIDKNDCVFSSSDGTRATHVPQRPVELEWMACHPLSLLRSLPFAIVAY
jgi:hypothetical protein